MDLQRQQLATCQHRPRQRIGHLRAGAGAVAQQAATGVGVLAAMHRADARHSGQQRGGIGHRQAGQPHVELRCGCSIAQRYRAALVQHQHPVAQGGHLLHQMAAEQHRPALTASADQVACLHHLHRVQAVGGFVQQQHLGVGQGGLGQAHPLAVTFGQGADDLARHASQRVVGHGLVHRMPPRRAAQAFGSGHKVEIVSHPQGVVQRRFFRQVADVPACRQRARTHRLAAHPHRTGVGRQKTGNQPQRSGFAAAIGAQQADDLTRLHLEADALQHGLCAIPFAHIDKFNTGSCWRRHRHRHRRRA